MPPISPFLAALVAALAFSCRSDALLVRPDGRPDDAGAGGLSAFCECFSTSKSPKLTVLSATVGLEAEYVAALRENRAIVADAYDYEFCEVSSNLSGDRYPVWTKVKAIQALLERGEQRVVAWMDADAFFVVKKPFDAVRTNDNEPIFELGKDLILTNDHPQGDRCGINLGVLVTNSSEWSRSFWQAIWDRKGPATDAMGLEEQSAVCLYRSEHGADFSQHARVIAHEKMNNVGHTDAKFIAHMAGGGFKGGAKEKYVHILPIVNAANAKMRGSNNFRLKDFFGNATLTDKFQLML